MTLKVKLSLEDNFDNYEILDDNKRLLARIDAKDIMERYSCIGTDELDEECEIQSFSIIRTIPKSGHFQYEDNLAISYTINGTSSQEEIPMMFVTGKLLSNTLKRRVEFDEKYTKITYSL